MYKVAFTKRTATKIWIFWLLKGCTYFHLLCTVNSSLPRDCFFVLLRVWGMVLDLIGLVLTDPTYIYRKYKVPWPCPKSNRESYYTFITFREMDKRIEVILQHIFIGAPIDIIFFMETTQRCKSAATFTKKIEVRFSNNKNRKLMPVKNIEFNRSFACTFSYTKYVKTTTTSLVQNSKGK